MGRLVRRSLVEYLEAIRQKVRRTPIGPAPSPWKMVTSVTIGGLTEVGFADDDELLLVLSWQGRGVFDCATGERLTRDQSGDRTDWYGRDGLIARGFGPLDGQTVRLCGLWGGGLSTYTRDSWHAEAMTLQWPDQHLLLVEPQVDLYRANSGFHKLAVESAVRAFGFSHTGRTLLIATSSDITVYGRRDF